MSRRSEATLVVVALVGAASLYWFGFVVPRFRPGVWHFSALDLEMYFYPKFAYGARALAHGRIPLWNPLEYCGLPFLATAQVAALYPVSNVLFWLFTPPVAMQANFVVHVVIAGVCEYAYARWLGLGAPSAALGAAVWAFSGNSALSIHHPVRLMVLAWMPLAVLTYERALARRTVGAVALAGATVALQVMAGYPGLVLLEGVVLGLVTLVRGWEALRTARPWAVGASVMGVLGFALALAAPQVLPLAEMIGETSRTALVTEWQTISGAGPPLGETLRQLVPSLLTGTVVGAGPAAAFALAGAVLGRGATRAFLVGGLFLAYAAAEPARPLFQHLPGFGLLRMATLLWMQVAPFFVASLAALGFERTLGRERAGTAAVAVVVVALPALGAVVLWAWIGVVAPALVVAVALGLLALVARRQPRLGPLAGVGASAGFFALALLGLPFQSGTVPYPRTLPDPALATAVRAAAPDARLHASMLVRNGEQMLSEIPMVTGFEGSLHPARVGRLIEAAGLRELSAGRPTDWAALSAHRALLDLLGVALIVSPGTTAEVDAARLVMGPVLPRGLPSFRNPTVLRRAFVVHRVESVAGPEEAFAATVDAAFEPALVAVVEGPAPPVAPADRPAQARIAVDEPEHLRIEADLSAPGLLVVTDAYFPGWTTTVDGTRVPMLRADYAFRGVPLSAGAHTVEMRYRPLSFWVGVGLAAAAALTALAAWVRR